MGMSGCSLSSVKHPHPVHTDTWMIFTMWSSYHIVPLLKTLLCQAQAQTPCQDHETPSLQPHHHPLTPWIHRNPTLLDFSALPSFSFSLQTFVNVGFCAWKYFLSFFSSSLLLPEQFQLLLQILEYKFYPQGGTSWGNNMYLPKLGLRSIASHGPISENQDKFIVVYLIWNNYCCVPRTQDSDRNITGGL